MAGEYSRELSEKMPRKRQQAQLGYGQGGTLIYGFRRLLVDAEQSARQVLQRGERKALTTDKVMVIPGPPEELEVIRRLFSDVRAPEALDCRPGAGNHPQLLRFAPKGV